MVVCLIVFMTVIVVMPVVMVVLAVFMIVVFVSMFVLVGMIVNQGKASFVASRSFPQDDRTNAGHAQEENATDQHKGMELGAQHQIQHGHLPEEESQANAAKSPGQGNQAQLVQIIGVAVFVKVSHDTIIPPQDKLLNQFQSPEC
jgi:hypothetical protein